jgi:site-specific DNA recombinase
MLPCVDAVLYARISLDRAGTQLGVRRQMIDLRALSAARGDRVVGEFVDDNESIYRRPTAPPQYRQMKALVETGRVNAIYVWHPDRLYRSLRDLEDLVDMVDFFQLTICTVRAGMIDLNTPSGRMVARMLGTAARYELEHEAERIARKHAEKAAMGLPSGGGPRPIGYADDHVTIVEHEAAAIRAAARALLAGETYAFANQLYQQMIGRPVHPRQLRQVLDSPRIAGLRQYIPAAERRRGVRTGGQITRAVWPAIIDYDTWAQIRALLTDPRRRKQGARRTFLLSGLMICERCGVRLVGAARAYKCAGQVGGCSGIAVTKAGAERVVVSWCRSSEQQNRLKQAAGYRDGRPDEPSRAIHEQRRSELALLYADGRISAEEWITARTEIDNQDGPTLLARRERRRRGELAQQALDILAQWDTATAADQRIAVRITLGQRQVFVATVGTATGRFDPSRITILDENDARPLPEFIRFRPHGPGNPTKMTPDNITRALRMLADGYTKSAICRTLHVSRPNLYKHLGRQPQHTRDAELAGARVRQHRRR